MDKTVVAIVPVKGNSGRVPGKNFRDFHDGRSLLQVKLEQLRRSQRISKIYISSESDDAEKVAAEVGVEFIRRDPRLTLDETPWSQVLCGVLEQTPVDGDTFIAWSPVTNPLFTRYDDAIDLLSDEHDSVMSVTRQQHYFLNADFLPLNYQWGVWASYSQKLKPIYQMNCALWLAPKKAMIQNRFQIGDRPTFLTTDAIEGLDIDTPDEFEMAQYFYRKRFGGQGA